LNVASDGKNHFVSITIRDDTKAISIVATKVNTNNCGLLKMDLLQ